MRVLFFVVFFACSSCGTVNRMNALMNESSDSIDANREAVQRSTQLIRENQKKIEASTATIKENRKQLESVK